MAKKRKRGGDRPLRLLAHLDASECSSRGMVGGILRYAALHHDVEVQLYGPGSAHRRIEDFHDWRPDGIIAGETHDRSLRIAESMGCRAAVLAEMDAPAGMAMRQASVFCDDEAIASAVADFLVECGAGVLAYVGDRLPGRGEEPEWSVRRGEALRGCASAKNCSFASFRPEKARRRAAGGERAALAAWIARLPRPCAILAANDMRASAVLDACRDAGVAVPQAAMVVGVDDEAFICGQMRPTLTSVIPDWYGGGYLEAETLVELLRGRAACLPPRTFGILGIARRQSTGDPNEARLMVSRALEFIRDHAARPEIGVGDVAKAAFASRRLLQQNFRSVTGRTVCEALQEERLRRVRETLTGTRTPIGEIAALCGFASDGYLKELFRRRFGCSMRAFRGK